METVYESRSQFENALDGGRIGPCLVRDIDAGGLPLAGLRSERVSFKSVAFGAADFRRSVFRSTSFTESALRGADFGGARFENCSLRGSELIEARLSRATFDRSQLQDTPATNANFEAARLLNTTFESVNLYGAHFGGSLIVRTVFHDPKLGNAILSHADFSGAVLIDVDLRGANLYRARFDDALFIRCDLSDANLVGARFEGARFIATSTARADVDDEHKDLVSRSASSTAEAPSLSDALSRFSREDLSEMLVHALKVYVVDGTAPNAFEYAAVALPSHLRDLDFAQLVSHLKMHLALPELDRFSVSGREVMVRIGERDYALGDPNTLLPPREHEVPTGPSAQKPMTTAPTAAEPEEMPDAEIDDRFRMLEFD